MNPNGIKECGDVSVVAGRGPGQLGWYSFALRFVKDRSVLDVGTGTAKGLNILLAAASVARGQDLDPRLVTPLVDILPIEEIPSKSYDVVTSIDVIEHVSDPHAFVLQLARIARLGIFVSTPNWTASRCTWPYHLREYTPRQLVAEMSAGGAVTLFKGTSPGDTVFPIRHPALFSLFNDLRTWPLTCFPARCWNNLIPTSARLHSHLAAWVDVR